MCHAFLKTGVDSSTDFDTTSPCQASSADLGNGQSYQASSVDISSDQVLYNL